MLIADRPSRVIQRRRLGQQLYDVLRERIAGYRFLAGKKLDLEVLAEELEVSRPPLWEAVCRLEQEGLVEIKPNRGVYVTEVSWLEASELYQVRGVLECLAARLAVPRIMEEGLALLASLLEEHKKLIEDGDWYRFSPMDHKLHGVLYDACGNGVLKEELLRIKIRLGMLRLDIQPLLSDLYVQHCNVYDALRTRNIEEAVASVAAHNYYMENYCRLLYREAEALGGASGLADGHGQQTGERG